MAYLAAAAESKIIGQMAFDFAFHETPTPPSVKTTKPTLQHLQPSNYKLSAKTLLSSVKPLDRAKANIDAIKLLKNLVADNATATNVQKKTLAKYVGWGGLSKIFNKNVSGSWADLSKELKSILTDEEYAAARAGTLSAFYTSPVIINAIYRGLQRLGFKGGRILEPSCGIGHFIGSMPPALAKESQVTGIELDTVSGKIATLLYPKSDIRVEGFEKAQFANDSFDVVIGNIPFGDFKLYDPAYPPLRVHDYFIAKSIDLVRPGGVVAVITSTGTLDKANSSLRAELAEKADLVGAIRLPDDCFKAQAGTVVASDILFLRKRVKGDAPIGEQWIKTEELPQQPDQLINEYFTQHPSMILGDLQVESGRFGSRLTVKSNSAIDVSLKKAIKSLPDKILSTKHIRIHTKAQENAENLQGCDIPADIQEGAYFLHNGIVYRKEHGQGVVLQKRSKTDLARIHAYVKLRAVVKELVDGQLGDATDKEIEALQSQLHQEYDAFYSQFGPINHTNIIEIQSTGAIQRRMKNLRAFRDDPDTYLVASIEDVHEDDDSNYTYTKGAIFSRRVIRRAKAPEKTENVADALAISLNEYGYVNLDRISQLYQKPVSVCAQELDERIYKDPKADRWLLAEEYLSGNVRKKFEQAKNAAIHNPDFDRNVNALELVIPEDLKPADITVSLGAPWVPASVVSQFVEEILGHSSCQVEVHHSSYTASWSVKYKAAPSAKARTEWGTSEYSTYELVEKALNFKTPTVYKTIIIDGQDQKVIDEQATVAATVKMREIEREFTGDENTLGWVWREEKRAEQLARTYNDLFNSTVARQYDGSHLTFPGLASYINDHNGIPRLFNLDNHQKDAVWRIVAGGNALIAHCVGAGKTFSMVVGGQELKRLGMVNMPAYAVPNHMLEQFSREYMMAYPGSRILVADKENFTREKRKLFTSRIATGDYDAVIITHSAFGRIGMSVDYQKKFLQAELDELEKVINEHKRDHSPTVKDLERAKRGLQARIEKLINSSNKDDGLIFEKMGVDYLFVDESHLFKNLSFVTKMERVKGLQNSASQRATDLLMKTRWLQGKNAERVATFATATPVSNTIAEMFTIQRYLQPKRLTELGISHFDAWSKTFGQVIEDVELAPSGKGLRVVRKFARFRNVPELISAFSEVADFKTREMLDLTVPALKGGEAQVIVAEASDWQKAKIDELAARADALKGRRVEPGADNMLLICSEGRKAALDPRLLDPSLPDDPNSKVNMCVNNVFDIWKKGDETGKAQLIFCDMGVPGSKKRSAIMQAANDNHGTKGQEKDLNTNDISQDSGFSVYEDIKAKLIAKGVPAQEIAFIHDAKTDHAKALLFAKIRKGLVRVCIGSTEKMGVGSNVQRLLVALHHLDAPWRPTDVSQRDGRIERQGNMNDEIQIFRYVTAGTFDAYMWQTLETKAKFIGQILAGAKGVRNIDDIDSPLPEAEAIKAMATGDSRIIEQAMLNKETTELTHVRNAFLKTRKHALLRANQLPEEIKNAKSKAANMQHDSANRGAAVLQIGSQQINSIKEAGKQLSKIIAEANAKLHTKYEYKRFDVQNFAFGDFSIEFSACRTQKRINWDTVVPAIDMSFKLKGKVSHIIDLDRSRCVSVKSIKPSLGERVVKSMLDTYNGMEYRANQAATRIGRLEAELVEVDKLAKKPFPQEKNYQNLVSRLAALTKELMDEQKEKQKEAA